MTVSGLTPQEPNKEPQHLSIDDVKSLLSGMADAILTQVDTKLAAVQPQAPTAKEPEGKSTLSSRIQQLEEELQRRDKEKQESELKARYNSTFETELSRYKLAHPKETADLLRSVFQGQVTEVDGKWLTKDGKSFTEVVDGFMSTPFGQHLVEAPQNQSGSGTRGTNAPRSAPTETSSIAKLFGLG